MQKRYGQFTGLYDKNGKEIYEGDIVKSLISIFVIIFEKGTFKVKGININQKYTIEKELSMCQEANVGLEVIREYLGEPRIVRGGLMWNQQKRIYFIQNI